jgi:hypothetical protein
MRRALVAIMLGALFFETEDKKEGKLYEIHIQEGRQG